MKVGIHCGRYGETYPFINVYKKILEFNNIQVVSLNADEPDFFEKTKEVDAFIYRWYHYDYDRQLANTILPIIEHQQKVKCFPDTITCWHFDDKIRQYYLMSQNEFPMVQSWIFWDKMKALEWTQTMELPIVFKLKGGAGSQNVVLVKERSIAVKLIKKSFESGFKEVGFINKGSTYRTDFNLINLLKHSAWLIKKRWQNKPVETFYQKHKNYVLFQKFLPGNAYDTRVTIIGTRAYAFRRFNRPNDFRSSGSGLIDNDPSKIDMKHIIKAFEVSKTMKFQSMAYDFLYNENNESQFCEISYSFVDTYLYKCPGFWDDNLKWHEGNFWPQYFQLQDLLNLPNLKQPEI